MTIGQESESETNLETVLRQFIETRPRTFQLQNDGQVVQLIDDEEDDVHDDVRT